MRYILFFLFFIFSSSANAKIEVAFTPSLDCENKIIELIDSSVQYIDVAVYSINNINIVKAIKRAFDRKVAVRILTDKTQASGKYSKTIELYKYGIILKVHTKHKIEHNKFAIFDGKTVSTGSYNWTNPASSKNSENCVFIIDKKEVIAKYQKRFDYLWDINSQEKSDKWLGKKV